MKILRDAAKVMSLIVIAVSSAAAAPVVSGVQGTVGHNQIVQISGSGFGTKVPAAPHLWADFSSGLNPSSLGLTTSWAQVQNMQWSSDGYSGGGAKASDGEGVWTLRTDYNSWTRDGQRSYIFKRIRMNFQITSTSQNWKTWRIWPPNGTGYPNIYMASNNGRVFVEKIGGESGFWGSFKLPSTNWVTEETILKASSAMNVKDGLVALRHNGVERTRGSVLTRSSTSPSLMVSNYVVHGVLANMGKWSPAWSRNNRMWVDDVYVDTTWSRVMLGDASTVASCRKLDIQIPSAWSSNAISIKMNTPSFGNGVRAYLYVFDRDGNANANGYPVTIGASGPTTPPPPPPPPVNAAPEVSVGADITVTNALTVPLQAQASDDGLPNPPAALSFVWRLVSGPGTVTFGSANSPATVAAFTESGNYALELEVSDGELTAVDRLNVTVGISAPSNVAPVVQAGPDQSVTLPAAASLDGTVSDDGLPSNHLSVSWFRVSGPGTVAFDTDSSVRTNASFSAAGTYVLRLRAEDGSQATEDDLQVEVAAPAGGSASPETLTTNAYRNVFNPARGEEARIFYALHQPGSVHFRIYDRVGRQVRELRTGDRPSGDHWVAWDGRNDAGSTVASGIYLVVGNSSDGNRIRQKVAVLK